MEVLTRPSAREFATQYETLNITDFAKWIFSFKMELREWAELKEEFHQEFPETAQDASILKSLSAIIGGTAQRELEDFKNRIEEELQPFPLTDKIAYLEKRIEENNKEKTTELNRINHNWGNTLLNFHLYDFDGNMREPWESLVRKGEHLDSLLKTYRYDQFVETTPIVQRISLSLHDFEFSEWCEKVVREEPEYKLPYYIKIKTAVELYSNHLKKLDPKRNYWNVRRKCRYDEESGIEVGPMNNYSDFNVWLDKQVTLYSSEKPSLGKDVRFNNHKNIYLSEPVIKNHLDSDINEFDVTSEHNTSCGTYKKDKVLCKDCAMSAFYDKIKSLQYVQRKKWLDYQVNLRTDKEQFLDELEGLLNDYDKEFNSQDYGLTSHFHSLIDDKRTSLQGGDGNGTTKRIRLPMSALTELLASKSDNNLPKVKWNGTDTELLELIVALTQARKIVNEQGNPVRKEITEFFEKAFDFEIKDAEKKISATKNRKKGSTPFLHSLIKAFEMWEAKSYEK